MISSESLQKLRGQGTIEYLLLTTLVLGVALTVFNGPLKKLTKDFTDRKGQYTQVVSQQPRLGIPIAWFKASIPDPKGGGAGTAGATTAGNSSDGSNPSNSGGPGNTSGPATGYNPGSGQNNGGDTAGGLTQGDNGGGAGAGGGANGRNSALNNNGSRKSSSLGDGRNKGKTTAGADNENAEEIESGGRGSANRSARDRRNGASLDSKDEANKDSKANGVKIKNPEDSESLSDEKQLYGPAGTRVRSGSCDNIDMKVVLQIVFVIGLLFLLASMLFQNRGSGDE